MSFFDDNLGKNEQLVYSAKISKVCLIIDLVLCIVIALICAMVSFWFIMFGMLLLVKIIYDLVVVFSTKLGFSNKRILGKIGFLTTDSMDSPLSKIQNVSIRRGLFGKIFGYGGIAVTTASGSYRFGYVIKPNEFKSELMEAIDKAEEEKMLKQAETISKASKTAKSDAE